MIRLMLAAVLLGAAQEAKIETDPDLTPEYYDTVREAAIAGIKIAYDRSNAYEYGGVIVRTTNGKFRVGLPDTSYRGDGVNLDYEDDYAGYEIVADYHTHPCLPYSHWPAMFSNGDTNSNDNQNITGFMGDLCSGVVREYVPNVTPRDMCWRHSPAEIALARVAGVNLCGAHGTEIGSIPITKQPIIQEVPGPITKARGMNCW